MRGNSPSASRGRLPFCRSVQGPFAKALAGLRRRPLHAASAGFRGGSCPLRPHPRVSRIPFQATSCWRKRCSEVGPDFTYRSIFYDDKGYPIRLRRHRVGSILPLSGISSPRPQMASAANRCQSIGHLEAQTRWGSRKAISLAWTNCLCCWRVPRKRGNDPLGPLERDRKWDSKPAFSTFASMLSAIRSSTKE